MIKKFTNQKTYISSNFFSDLISISAGAVIGNKFYTNFNHIITRSLSRGLPKISSIDSSNSNFNLPLKRYENAEVNKSLIFEENINKSFVYRWINNINGKDYLGSTSNAKSRLSTYYDRKSLSLGNMPIYKAILKYGHSNFTFEIIEYCESKDVVIREQYYLDHFDFDYNILEKADSLLGYKHTFDTLAMMKGRKNALGYKHTLETLTKLREAQTDKKHSEKAMAKMREVWSERKLKVNSSSKSVESKVASNSRNQRIGKCIIITNIDSNVSTTYKSMTEAATVLNVTRNTLRSYIKNKNVFILVRTDTSIDSKEDNTKVSNVGLVKERYIIEIKE
jgi:group I intron endonuclease